MRKLTSQIFKIGIQTLWHDEETDKYYVSIKNRTYFSRVEIAKNYVPFWLKAFADESEKHPKL